MDKSCVTFWLEIAKIIVMPILSFVAALYGLHFASKLTEKRDRNKENERIDKEVRYIAIMVTAHLDKVVKSCVSIALDGGTYDNPQNVRETQTNRPVFDPLKIDADWRVLPTGLQQKILELPYKLERTDESVEGAYENDYPLDYNDFFDTRRYNYSVLGLETSELMFELREYAGMPLVAIKEGEWSRQQIMTDMINAIDERRKKHQSLWNAGNSLPACAPPAPSSY
jgi:hypothetical protein